MTLRTVTGPTDHVVVVGAGLGGLSAALRLAGAGRAVTVLERESRPGGRAGLVELPPRTGRHYRFDTGPTVLTMPDLIADCFDAVGERLEDWLDLEPVDPLYRSFYADGSRLDVHADVDAMAAEVERGLRAGRGRRLPPLRRLRLEALPLRDARLHRPQHRLAARPAHPEPRPARRDRRLPPAGAQGRRSTSRTRARSGSVQLPVDVRRPLAVRRARHLRGHRLHGLGRRRVLPQGRHARRAARAGRRGREARRRDPLRHDGYARRAPSAAGPSPCTPRTASGSPRTSSCSTRTCRSPTATCSAAARGRCAG